MKGKTIEENWKHYMGDQDVKLEIDKESFVKTNRAGKTFPIPDYQVMNMCVNVYATFELLMITNSKKSKKALSKIKKVKCSLFTRTKECKGSGQCKMGPYPQPRIDGDTLHYPVYEYSYNVHHTLYYLLWRAYDLGGHCPDIVPECGNHYRIHNPARPGGNKRAICLASKVEKRWVPKGRCSDMFERRDGEYCVTKNKRCQKYKAPKDEGKWVDYGQKKCKGCKLTSDGKPGYHRLRGPYFKWDKTGKKKGPRFGTLKL